jgi:hypothetical protein
MTFQATLTRLAPLCILLAMACDDQTLNADGTPTDTTNQPSDRSTGRAAVSGSVDGETQIGAVTAFRVQADGSLTAVSESTNVSEDGSYRVDVELDGEADANSALIIASSSAATAGAVRVMGELAADAEATANTIDRESTTEVGVFLELVADGMTEADGNESGMIDALISAHVAASASGDSEMGGLAEAVLSVLVTLDATAEQHANANEAAMEDAEGDLTLDTLLMLGFNEVTLSIAIHAAAEATTAEASNSGSADSEAMLATEIERIRGELAAQIVADSSVNIGLTVIGTASVEDNNDSLLGDLLGEPDLTVGVNLSQSWDAWSDSLMIILETDLSAESRTAMEEADQAAAEAETELEIVLNAAFAAESDAQARAETTAQAMADFEATVRADARVQALADTDFGEAGAASRTDILIQVHASVD